MAQFRKSDAAKRILKETSDEKNLLWVDNKVVHFDDVNKEIYADDSHVEEYELLKEDIRINGINQPLLVRPHDKFPLEYIVISGHRRLKALKELNQKVPVLVYKVETPQDLLMAKIALVTTNQLVRKRTPYEMVNEINTLKEYLEELKKINPGEVVGSMRKNIAKIMNITERSVQTYYKLNNIIEADEEIKKSVIAGQMTINKAIQTWEEKQKSNAEEKLVEEELVEENEKKEEHKNNLSEKDSGGAFIQNDDEKEEKRNFSVSAQKEDNSYPVDVTDEEDDFESDFEDDFDIPKFETNSSKNIPKDAVLDYGQINRLIVALKKKQNFTHLEKKSLTALRDTINDIL